MKTVLVLSAASVLSAAVLSVRFGREVWLGMIAPLIVVSGSWLVMKRVYRINPERLNSVMITAFAGKLAFFGLYVAFAIVVLAIQPVPFVLSLTSYFVALHMIEAILLKRMLVS